MPPLPPGYAEVVRAHHAQTTAYLLATSSPCRALRDEEIRRVQRRLERIEPADLAGFAPRGSWLLAVLLCPGDDVQALAVWAARLPAADLDRIRMYRRRGVDAAAALAAWVEAGLPPPLMSEVRDFASLHKVLGRHLNDRVWLDHA